MNELQEQVREAARIAETESMGQYFNAMSWLDLILEDTPWTFDSCFDTPWTDLSEAERVERARIIRSVLWKSVPVIIFEVPKEIHQMISQWSPDTVVRKNMKKTFTLTHPKIKYPRLVEAARHDVKKYLKRERNKKLPDGVDFWDFDCRFGNSPEDAVHVHVAEIGKCIDKIAAKQQESFYLEILAKPGVRTKKPNPVE